MARAFFGRLPGKIGQFPEAKHRCHLFRRFRDAGMNPASIRLQISDLPAICQLGTKCRRLIPSSESTLDRPETVATATASEDMKREGAQDGIHHAPDVGQTSVVPAAPRASE